MGLELFSLWYKIRGDSSNLRNDLDRTKNVTKSSMNQMVSDIKGTMSTVAALAGAFTGAFTAVKSLSSMLMKAGQFEQTTIAFGTMIGSAKETQRTLQDLTDFAAKTPFEMPEIESAARGLIQFGERGESLMDTLKMLGDAASGTSTPFGFLALVFNQIRGVGKLLTQDFRQLSTRGILSLQDIADYYGVATDAAQTMISKGKVSFDDLKGIFKMLTSEGGRFANMMEKQSTSMMGLWSTLEDAMNLVSRAIGESLLPIAKKLVGVFITVVEWVRGLTESFKGAIGTFVAVGTVITVLTSLYLALTSAIGMAALAMLPMAGALVAITAAVTGIVLLVKWLWRVVTGAEEAENRLAVLNRELETTVENIKANEEEIQFLQDKSVVHGLNELEKERLELLKKQKGELEMMKRIREDELKGGGGEEGAALEVDSWVYNNSAIAQGFASASDDFKEFEKHANKLDKNGDKIDVALAKSNAKMKAWADKEREILAEQAAQVRKEQGDRIDSEKAYQDLLHAVRTKALGKTDTKSLAEKEGTTESLYKVQKFREALEKAKGLSTGQQAGLTEKFMGGRFQFDNAMAAVDKLNEAMGRLKPTVAQRMQDFNNFKTYLDQFGSDILSAAQKTEILTSKWKEMFPEQEKIKTDLESIRQTTIDLRAGYDDITTKALEWARATGASRKEMEAYSAELREQDKIKKEKEEAKRKEEGLDQEAESIRESMKTKQQKFVEYAAKLREMIALWEKTGGEKGMSREEATAALKAANPLRQRANEIREAVKDPAETYKELMTEVKGLVSQGLLTEKEGAKFLLEKRGDLMEQAAAQSGFTGVRDLGRRIQEGILENKQEARDEKRNAMLANIEKELTGIKKVGALK